MKFQGNQLGHAAAPGRSGKLEQSWSGIAARGIRLTLLGARLLGAWPSEFVEMVAGKSIDECRELTVGNLIEALGGMPPDELHCPALAIGALHDALAKWPRSQK